jgi:quercetin 2,3-dioxygenase
VLNEDRVSGGNGFPTHGHSNYEIFSLILSGSLLHKDSMGNKEVLTRGQVQFTSAGTGIQHSEFNADAKLPVHFLQIWSKPNANGLKPGYQTGLFEDAKKKNALLPLITPDGSNGTIKINQDLRMFATILDDGAEVAHALAGLGTDTGTTRRCYLHVPETAGNVGVTVTGTRADGAGAGEAVLLGPGDGAFVEGLRELRIRGGRGGPPPATIAAGGVGGGGGAAPAAKPVGVAEVVVLDFAWP